MAVVILQIEKPISDKFLNEIKDDIIREDDESIFVSEYVSNRYQGDDETIVQTLWHSRYRQNEVKYSIVWEESDY